MRLFLILLAPCLALAQAPAIPGCQAPDVIRDAIENAQKTADDDNRPYTEIQKDRAAKLKELLAKHPDAFFVEIAYVEASRVRLRAPDEVVKEYKQRLEQGPNDPAAQYLYALTLMGRQTPESIKVLTKLATEHPNFARPFATLASIYGFSAFRDEAKLEANARTYVTLCPENLDGYSRLTRLPNSAYLKEAAERFRKLIAGRTDDRALGAWPTLWQLEFKVTPVPEHPRLRRRVEQDVAWLKSLDPKEHKQIGYVLREGAKTTGDKEGGKAALEMDRGSGAGLSRAFEAMNEWSKNNPYPKPGDPEEKRQAYYEARLAASEEWVKIAGDEPFFLLDRARNLGDLTSRPDSEFLAVIDQYFEAEKARKSRVRSSTPDLITVASLYAKRGVRLDDVPRLVQEGLEEGAKRDEEMDSDLLFTADRKDREQVSRWHQKNSAWAALFDACLKQKRFDKARDTLVEMDRGLREWRTKVAGWEKKLESLPKDKPRDPGISSIESAVKNLPVEEAKYHEALAKLAAAESRKLDALGFYQAALRLAREGVSSKYWEDQWAPKTQALWKDLGGTSEGWQNWVEQLATAPRGRPSQPPPSHWTKMERPLPEFAVSDLAGTTWKKASLAGKTAFVNLWATWCGPCREELPHLQKLYDRVKDREDVTLITFNIDDNIGAVEPFMKENKYTFPVLLAKDVIDSYLGSWSIPRNWLVDRAGVLRFEQIGFGMVESEEWIKKMIEQIDVARGSF